MTRLGIVVALAAEARTLGLRGKPCEIITTPNGDVMVSVSGIGAKRARIAGQRLLAQGANSLLSWGTAVALDATFNAGQLLLPCQVLQDDQTPLPVASGWQHQLCDRLKSRFPVNQQPLIGAKSVLTRSVDKQCLMARSGAVAADMESAALAELARDAGVPFVILRTIADTVSTRIPAWTNDIIDEYGRVRRASSLLPLLSHPADWRSLFHLARDFRAALDTLKAVLQYSGFSHLKPVHKDNKAAVL